MKQVTLVLFSLLVTSLLFAKELPPRAQKARELTTSLIGLNKSYQKAQGKNKEELKQKLIAKAQERRDYLIELMQTNPRQVLAVAIPNEKQSGLPAEVIGKLEQKRELEGKLELLYADNFEHPDQSRFEQFLKTPSDGHFELHAEQSLKRFQSGQQIRVNGIFFTSNDKGISDGHFAIGDQDEDILILGAENGPSYGTSPGPLANTFGEQRILFMMINFQDNSTQPWSKTDILATMATVNNFYQEVSYGQTWLNTNVVGWYTLPMSNSTCDRTQMTRLADEAASDAGININDYDRLIYSIPNTSSCYWGGLGTVGGSPSRAWFNGTPFKKSLTHELGHNLGLYHSHDLNCGSTTLGSTCSIKEYGDGADNMGSGTGHFNVFQKDRLGWLDGNIVTITSSGRYQLSPQEFVSDKPLALKVLKGFNSTLNSNDWYYLEYRQALGEDSGLGYSSMHNLTSGLSIHTGNETYGNSSYLLDMNPDTSSFSDAALNIGQAFTDINAELSFTTEWTNSTGAEVYINVIGGGGGQDSCLRANPSLSFNPEQGSWVSAGISVSYEVTVTNNDSAACASNIYGLSASVPTGWSSAFENSSLNLAPGDSASTTLSVISPNTASDGFYDISVTAASGSYSTTGSVTYVIDNPEISTNSAPIALSDTVQTTQDNSVTINVLANDSDPDGDALSISNYTQAVHGTLLLVDNVFTYTPDIGFSGSDSFSYTIADGKGGNATALVSISVALAPEPPVIIDNTDPTISILSPQDGTLVSSKQVVPILVDAQDNVGVAKVEYYVNGSLQFTNTTSPYSFSFKVPSGRGSTYQIEARAYDTSNRTQSASITLSKSDSTSGEAKGGGRKK